MAQLWYVLVPETGANIVKNPSAENGTNDAALSGTGSFTRTNSFAYSGFYGFDLNFDGGDYVDFTLSAAMANAEHTISLVVNSAGAGSISSDWKVSVNNSNYYSITGGDFTLDEGSVTDPNGARYYRTFSAAQCNGNVDIYIKYDATPISGSQIYVDAIQVQQKSYLTSYIDGDLAGCYWNGERHASSSTRSAGARSGGRLRNFDDYSIVVSPSTNRYGMPPVINSVQQRALQPGADFAGSRILPREINLTTGLQGTSLSNLHSLRQSFINLIRPDPTGAKQPVVLAYSGADSTRRVYAKFHYVSGLEAGVLEGFSETQPTRLVAVDPFWYEMGNVLHSLSYNSGTVSYARLTLRTQAGLWTSIGGLNNDVRHAIIDYQRNRVYICGAFTTGTTSAGAGQTLNYIAYWDGTYLNQMVDTGSGSIGLAGGVARAMALAPDGSVWVVGDFTTAGGSTATKLAKWNPTTVDWVGYDLTTGGGTVNSILACAVDKTGLLYIGGNFTDLTGVANADRIAAYDGTTVTALGTGANGEIRNIVAASDGNVYVSGVATTINGVTRQIAKWTGSAWASMSDSFVPSVYVRTVLEGEDGTIYIAGLNTLNAWYGTSLVQLYDFGVEVGELSPYANDTVMVSMGAVAATLFGGSSFHAVWNKTTFALPDFLAPSGGQLYTQVLKNNAEPRNDVSVIAAHNGCTITSVGQVTSVTITGTAETSPVILITGPTTAASSCRVKWLENFITGERVYLNLLLNTGEYTIIDFRTGVKGIFSSWSSRPGPTPPVLRNLAINGGGLNVGALRAINDNPLPGSNFTAWNLVPGTANSIGVFISGTVTGVLCIMGYTPTHQSADGVA